MFLVPFNKKTLLNSATSTGPRNNYSSSSSSSSQSHFESHRDNGHQAGISILIIKSARLTSEILESSFETLKRWFGVFFRALLAALSPPPPVFCSKPIEVLAIASRQAANQLTWRETCGCGLPLAEVKYLRPLASCSAGNLNSARAFNAWKQQQQQQQEEHPQYQQHSTSTPASGFTDNSCEMDLCRRRVAQRAVAPEADHSLRSSSCYWMEESGASQPEAQEHRNSSQEFEVVSKNGSARELRRRELFQLHGHQLRPDGRQTEASGSSASDKAAQLYQHGSKQQQHQQQQPLELQARQQQQQDIKYPATSSGCSAGRSSSIASLMSFHNTHNHLNQQHNQNSEAHPSVFGRHQSSSLTSTSQEDRRRHSVRASNHYHNHHNGSIEEVSSATVVEEQQASLVLVSRSALSTLTDQIAFSMNKMKHLEEQVSVIPELKRRLDHVMNDNSKLTDCNRNSKIISNNLNGSETAMITDLNRNSSATKVNTTNDTATKSNLDHINHNHQQRHYNSFTRTNSLNTQLHAYYGSKDSNLAEHSRIVNNNNISNHNKQTSRRLSNVLRDTQDTANSSSSISSPKVEYEDLISDLISLSYSVNYLPNTSTDLHRYNHEQQQQQQQPGSSSQVKGLHGNKLEAHKQQHTKYIASGNNINIASSTSFIDYQASSHNDTLIDARYTADRGCNGIKCNPAQDQHEQQRSHSQATGCGTMVEKQVQSSCNDVRDTFSQSSRKSLNIKKNSGSSSLLSNLNNSNNNNNRFQDNMISDPSNANNHTYHQQQNHSQALYNSSLHHSRPTISHTRHQSGSGSLSLKTTPVKTALDCGCQSFKEHLKYNSLSREQRLNQANKQILTSNSTGTSNAVSPQPLSQKVDASTNTELSMCDIVTKVELNSLMSNIHKTYSTLSTSTVSQANQSNLDKINFHKPSSLTSDHSSGASTSEPKSSSPVESESFAQDRIASDSEDSESRSSDCSSNRGIVDENEIQKSSFSQDEEVEEDEERDEEEETNASSINSEEPYSLGSSYQDPSDFEEYCAYGESLDRRTKDFMSPSTKIPNDLKFALIRLNDLLKRHRPSEQIDSSSCIEVIKKEWFEVAATKNADAVKTKLYVDYFESFTKQLLNTVVNLVDAAGNTAMHYAASHYRLDVIKILLGTKVCDVNCRNKAGYTPIMLLALAEIEDVEEQDTAKRLFSIGDVNIRARSSGQTALMLAANHGRITTCKLLLECGADPSLQDYDGSTALMCGSEVGNEEIVRCLLSHRLTDPAAVDNDGLDALTIAMNNGHKNIGLLLYASKNVPRMFRSASLRRNSSRIATNYVRRADSLLGSRAGRQFETIEGSNL